MKKIKLELKKEVISILSGNELSQVWGGWKEMYSIEACETKEECRSILECESVKESCQGKCLSDGMKGGGNSELQPYIPLHPQLDSAPCNSFESNCLNPNYKYKMENIAVQK